MFSLSHFVPSVSQSVSLGKTLESCWKISPGKSIIRHFVKNIATVRIPAVAFYTKFMRVEIGLDLTIYPKNYFC